jgi:hypothetical protein
MQHLQLVAMAVREQHHQFLALQLHTLAVVAVVLAQ